MTTAHAVDRAGPSDQSDRSGQSGKGGQSGKSGQVGPSRQSGKGVQAEQGGRSGRTDQIDRFEAAASGAFAPLRMRTTGDFPFQGAFTSARVDQLVLTHITAGPVVVRRDADVITSTDPDLIKVAWHGAGRAGVDQGGRQCLLTPGDLVVYETGHPYELPFWEPYDTVVVGVPSARFGAHADVLRRRVAMPVRADGGLRGIVSAMFQGMASGGVGDGASGAAQHHLASALVSLVCAAFSDTLPSEDEDPMGRVRAYCLATRACPWSRWRRRTGCRRGTCTSCARREGSRWRGGSGRSGWRGSAATSRTRCSPSGRRRSSRRGGGCSTRGTWGGCCARSSV